MNVTITSFAILTPLLMTIPTGISWASSCAESPIRSSDQVILSVSPGWNSQSTRLWTFNRGKNGWKSATARPIDAVVGKNGMAWGSSDFKNLYPPSEQQKHEGDGRAPAGIFRLTEAFGYFRPELSGFEGKDSLPYLQSTPESRCVDDVQSKFYNRIVPDQTKVEKDWNSDEGLLRIDKDNLYKMAIVVDHNGISPQSQNTQPQPGDGSCIFMHIWRGKGTYTAGCTAMAEEDLKQIISWLHAPSKPLLIQLPMEEYLKQKDAWCLPEIPESELSAATVDSIELGAKQIIQTLTPATGECQITH